VLEPDRVASVTAIGSSFLSNTAISYPDYRDLRDGNHTFDGLIAAGAASFGFKPNADATAKVAFGFYVSGNFFKVLGVEPKLGRGFLPSEDQAAGRDAVVVLGHDYWRSQFNANPRVVWAATTIWKNAMSAPSA